jgi:hypothetical protein
MTGKQPTNPPLPKPDAVERIAGAPANTAGVAIFGVMAGDLAGLLPSLVDTLARGRQQARIDASLNLLDAALRSVQAQVNAMTDDQYKVVGECIQAHYSTVDEEKLAILREAAVEAATNEDAARGNADALSRMLRTLSVSEAKFIVANASYAEFVIGEEGKETARLVQQKSPDEYAMSGLISLGLLYTRSTSWGAAMYEWSPLMPQLMTLLSTPTRPLEGA